MEVKEFSRESSGKQCNPGYETAKLGEVIHKNVV